jgi:O-antigen/teichoic acid export membrane protein
LSGAVQQPGRQTLEGTVRIFLAEALILPTGLVTTVILTRELGPEGYGWFTLAASAVGWIEWSISAIFARASYLFLAQAADWRPVAAEILRLRLIVSVAAALVLFALAGPIAGLLREPVLETYLRLFAIDIPIFGAASAHNNILVGIGAFRHRAWPSAARWISRLVLIAVLTGLGFSIEGAIWASIGASLVELIAARCFVKPGLFLRSEFPVGRLWQQALPLTLFALSLRLFDRLDLFFLKALGASSAEAGWYGGAQNLSIVPGLVALSFSPLLLSTITRLIKDGAEAQARELARQSLRWIVALAPFAAMSAAAATEIVRLILGETFLGAARPLALLVFAALALVLVSAGTAILTAAGKATWTFYLTGPMVPVAAAGHLLLIPRFGIGGAALVTLITAALAALASVLAVHRLWRVLPPLPTVLRSVAISGGAYAVTAGWPAAGVMVVVKLVVVSVSIGLAFVLLGELPRPRVITRQPQS